jgi:hypothetical protein
MQGESAMKHRILSILLLFGYILGVQDGFVALWKDGQDRPIEVFPYSAVMLPKADQERLRDGIPIDNLNELHRLLEDYLS